MRDAARINVILGGLGAVWEANPDWRFGQLIENLFQVERKYGEHACIFHIEDDETKDLIRDAIRTDGNP